VNTSAPEWKEVLTLKPGLTDLATLVFRDEEKMVRDAADVEQEYRSNILPAKLALNIHYARSRTWLSDLKLVILTIRYSFVRRGFDASRIPKAILGARAAYTPVVLPDEASHV